jgi:nitrate/TMAO reductase-like tetraheme cytochrome c subunit
LPHEPEAQHFVGRAAQVTDGRDAIPPGSGADRAPPAKAPPLLDNWLSLIGIILSASSFFAAVCLIAIDYFRSFKNPYMGILTYILAPAFLLTGLSLTGVGVLRERRRRRRMRPGEVPRYPRLDLNVPRQRHAFVAVSVATFLFLILTAMGSYRTYQFTESVAFCGRTCHAIMRPEYSAYQESPHARVACVQCHIGPGASWFVKSKLSGAYQVYATLANRYPRPIPAPIKNLRPAQETCEQCHWPRKFYGAAERVLHHYLPDERNSPWTIRMLLNIGGGDPAFGPAGGIHWHMNIANRVEYIATDSQRQVIPWVRVTGADGRSTVYQSSTNPLSASAVAAARPRVMDCIDCHNRPTHIYSAPVTSVALAMSTGRIDPTIPFIMQQAVRALADSYPSTPVALRAIADTLTRFYRARYPGLVGADSGRLERAVAEVQAIYEHNLFPAMHVDWRVYPDNLGHWTFPGCFRCHDGNHVSAGGRVIPHDCKTCHTIIAQGPGPAPATVSAVGLDFRHPVEIGGAWRAMLCSDCHHGALVQ